jgi:hypothetical protein
MPSRTNARVASAATAHADLSSRPPILIGLIHRPYGSLAMIRDAAGRVLTVAPGVRIGDALVTAIGETGLHLEENGEERVLSIPAERDG